MGQTVHFATPNGGQVAGYLARAGGSAKTSSSFKSGGGSTSKSVAYAIVLPPRVSMRSHLISTRDA